jgi:hypothetical protein
MEDVWIMAVNFKDHKGEGGSGYLMIPFDFRPLFKYRMLENCFNCRKQWQYHYCLDRIR